MPPSAQKLTPKHKKWNIQILYLRKDNGYEVVVAVMLLMYYKLTGQYVR